MAVLNTNHLDLSIEQPDIIAAQDSQFVKSGFGYNVSNPHPKFGKDENILNEKGHTVYPKMIYPNGKDAPYVIVNNQDDEARVMKGEPLYVDDDGLRNDGPTIKAYVEAGFKASEYPPKGYSSKSSPEEIEPYLQLEDKSRTPSPWG